MNIIKSNNPENLIEQVKDKNIVGSPFSFGDNICIQVYDGESPFTDLVLIKAGSTESLVEQSNNLRNKGYEVFSRPFPFGDKIYIILSLGK